MSFLIGNPSHMSGKEAVGTGTESGLIRGQKIFIVLNSKIVSQCFSNSQWKCPQGGFDFAQGQSLCHQSKSNATSSVNPENQNDSVLMLDLP